MFMHLQQLLRRYWLISTVLAFALLISYSSLTAAQVVPTPDIETVPPLEELLTPTNTPFPTPTPATANGAPSAGAPPTATKRPPSPAEPESGGGQSGNTASQPPQGKPADAPAGANPPAASATNTTTLFSGVVAVTLLELRKTPATDGRIIATVFNHDQVTILGRSSDGNWWLVCCGSNQRQGWAPPQMIRSSVTLTSANALLPVISDVNGAAVSTAANASQTADKNRTTLQLEMRPNPAFVWQGQQFELQLTITNRGKTAATNLQLRNDLPAALRYRSARIDQQGVIRQQSTAEGNTLFTMDWKSLAPGAKATATLVLQVATDLPAGALIDNLALVTAQNAENAVAGLTLAMPPTLAPQFR